MNLSDIQNKPTIHEGIHESIFKSHSILNYVLKMLERGDSEETILEVVELLKDGESKSIIVSAENIEEGKFKIVIP